MQRSKEHQGEEKAFLCEQCKEIEENNRILLGNRLEISSRKLEISREYFMQRWGTVNGMDLTETPPNSSQFG